MNELMRNLLELQTLEFGKTIQPGTETRIEHLRTNIPPEILGHYDRLGARGKKGVALVRNNVCTGCHIHVPMAVTVDLMRGKDIALCENCGRYLCLPEKTTEQAAPASRRKPRSTEKLAAASSGQ